METERKKVAGLKGKQFDSKHLQPKADSSEDLLSKFTTPMLPYKPQASKLKYHGSVMPTVA